MFEKIVICDVFSKLEYLPESVFVSVAAWLCNGENHINS